jgi:hypothetical protein
MATFWQTSLLRFTQTNSLRKPPKAVSRIQNGWMKTGHAML